MRVRLNQQRLLAFLAQSPLSQNHWALKLGLSRGHWSEIVNGKHPYPSPRTRERMVEVLKLSFEVLFEIDASPPGWADTDFRRAIADRYLIDTELGQGGMGAVYLARDARHGRVVAIKVVSPEAVVGIGVHQFLREIATVAQIQHPHILPLFDSGEAAGHPFYVMPYIRGGSLRTRLEKGTRLPVELVGRITSGISAALEHAHRQRILHCDVKPENILLDGEHPYVMDFGIARKLHSEVLPWTWRKELDMTAGTPAYVSPEQASGEQDLDARSDVYSLACVVYEMLAGRAPFEGTTTEAIVSRRFVAPAPPIRDFAPEVPWALEAAVERGMALEPARRPGSAQGFAESVAAGAAKASGPWSRASIALTRALTRWQRPGRRAVRLRIPMVENIMNDVKWALRSLRRTPGFVLVTVLTLALGIGANTAIFSVIRGVLLKSLPHKDGSRLLYLRQSADGPGQANLTFSVPEVRDLRNGVQSLSGIAEFSSWSAVLQRDEGPIRLGLGLVTGNYFEVMGLSPILGRVTRPSDDGPAAAPVIVLGYETWRRTFGGDSAVVDSKISINNRPVTVIGVLQPAPFFPQQVDALMNMVISIHHMGASMQEGRTHRMTEVVARMRPGSTLTQVRTEVATVYTRLQQEYQEVYNSAAHYQVAVMPFKSVLGERAQLTLWLLMASAAFVLIASAANVANLTLMRGVRRDHELVMRAALGAGAPTLRRLLMVENLLLALAGAGVGIFIASNGVGLLSTFAGRYSTRANEIGLDTMVFGFTLVVAVGIAVILSLLAPLPKEGKIAEKILAGTRRASPGVGRHRMQHSLVVVQIAVSVILLASAGLLMRTVMELNKVDTGLNTEDVLTVQVSLPVPSENQPAFGTAGRARSVGEAIQTIEMMRDQITALPGVIAVGIGSTLPLRNSDFFNVVQAAGKPPAPGEPARRAEARTANPDYFRAAGIPMIRGRTFTTTDPQDVVIINKTTADQYFPNEDPIGKRIGWMMDWQPDTLKWQTVIGVVGNTRDGRLDGTPRAVVFWRIEQSPTRSAGLVIRADHAENLEREVRNIAHKVDAGALLEDVMTISQFKAEGVSPRRLNAVLISIFGGLAVLIAMVGIAGVLAFSVSARTSEIGIRMSLGADGARVQRTILQEGGTLVAIGLAIGIAGAFLATRVLRGLLFGVQPNDVGTFAAVTLVMGVVGIGACWIPARRAARIDPLVAMRSE